MRERGREAADEGKQPTCSRREACVGFNNSAGFTFQPVGGTSGSPLSEDGQNVASNSRPCVTASGGGGGGGATAGADLSPAAAGQRGKLYRHLSAQ